MSDMINLSFAGAKELAIACAKQKHPLFITGAPGTGKTSLAIEIANELGYDFQLETPVTSDAVDAKGLPVLIEENGRKRAVFLPFTNLERMMTTEKDLFVLIDDLGQSNQSVQAAYMHVVLAREVAGHKLSDKVNFVACSNRKADKAGVSTVIEPLKSRFVSIINLEPLTNEWISWANKQNLPVELISFIMYRPDLLSDFKPTSELVNSPSPRTVHHVGQVLEMQLSPGVEFAAIAGAAGEGFATEFKGFIDIWRNLPDIGHIIMNPTEAEVPVEPSVLYALTGALADKATVANFDNIMTYNDRLPVEFQVVLVRNALQRKGSAITKNQKYCKWLVNHKDVLFS